MRLPGMLHKEAKKATIMEWVNVEILGAPERIRPSKASHSYDLKANQNAVTLLTNPRENSFRLWTGPSGRACGLESGQSKFRASALETIRPTFDRKALFLFCLD